MMIRLELVIEQEYGVSFEGELERAMKQVGYERAWSVDHHQFMQDLGDALRERSLDMHDLVQEVRRRRAGAVSEQKTEAS